VSNDELRFDVELTIADPTPPTSGAAAAAPGVTDVHDEIRVAR
jgi:hypothetical protein